jgi:protein-tyrosine phosphatase
MAHRVPPAWFFPRILVGAGQMLTPLFAARYNITHVVNCAYPEHCPIWFQKTYPKNYVCLYAIDSPTVDILDWYPAFEDAMHRFLREPGTGTVFVHCHAGINRSASLALAYVCKNFGQDLESTLRSVITQRPIMFANRVFMNQVKTFINGCVSRAKDPGYVHGSSDGDIGFGSSRYCTESKGVDEAPDFVAGGTGEFASRGVGAVCTE